MKPQRFLALLCLTAVTARAGSESAPDPAPMTTAPAESGWWFRVAPYGWVTAIDGDMRIGPLSAPVDVSMRDTLRDLDMAAMGILEAGYGRWSVGADITYAKVSQDIAGGGRFFRGFRLEQRQWVINPAVAYRAIETESYFMEVFGGVRVNIIEADLTGRLVRGGQVTRGASVDWVDPVVGVRGQADLGESWFFRYNGDIGGFGAGADLTWQAFGGFGFRLNEFVSLGIGYRALAVDYDNGAFALDTITHGPLLGLEIRW
jgi:hypothetical protein